MESLKNEYAGVPSLNIEGEPLPTLVQGSAILLASFAIASVLRYGFHFSLGRILEPAEYGMLGVGEAVWGIMTLFTSTSFPWVATRFLSSGKYKVINSCLLGNFIIGFIICSLLYGSFVSGILKLDASYHNIIIILIASVWLGSLGSTYVGVLQGVFRFRAVAIIRALAPLLLVSVGLPLVMLGFGATGAMMGYIFVALLTLGLGISFTRDLKPLSGKWIDKEAYLFALPLFIGVLGTQLLVNVDILGVRLFSPEAVADTLTGYYKAAAVWARIPLFMITAIVGVLFPTIARYTTDTERVKHYSFKFIKYACVFLLPINLIFILIPAKVIVLIYPQGYAEAGSALAILSIGMFLMVLVTVLAIVFQATGRPTSVAIVLGPAVALQIVLLYLLVPKYGLVGAAVSTTVCSAFALLVLLFKYAQVYRLTLRFLGVVKLIMACLVQAGLLLFSPTSNKPLVAGAIIVSYVLYLVILSLLRFFKSEDVKIIFSGILPEDNKFLKGAINVVAGLNRVGGQH